MKMCMPHWDALRQAITDRGLDKFVSNSGEDAAQKLANQLEPGMGKVESYDPLMNAFISIMSNALDNGGPYLLMEDPDGNHYCPLCEAEKHSGNPGIAERWIGYASDEQLECAREYGLIPPEVVQ